jgi:hypothetical protein
MDPSKILYYRVTAVDGHGYESEPSEEFLGVALPHPDDTNQPATFNKPTELPQATAGVAYNVNISNQVSDRESDPLHFYKVSGPKWLNVGYDGTLSGTPDPRDVGMHKLTIQVYSHGGRDETKIDIVVNAPK